MHLWCFNSKGKSHLDLPLFPDAVGKTATKAKMVDTIMVGARSLGVEDLGDGSERVSGHSFRSTGAQGLIVLG